MNAKELYDRSVRSLPVVERCELVRLIIDGLAKSATGPLDVSDEWSVEDIADFTAASLKSATAAEMRDAVEEWLQEVQELQSQIRQRVGNLPDSTPEISADRNR